MPYCAVLQCRNDIRNMNLANKGVTYHRFPVEPDLKEKWINATGRLNWQPMKTSTICSLHFTDKDLLQGSGGQSSLVKTAVPSLDIISLKQENTIFEHFLLNPTENKEQEVECKQDTDPDTTEVIKPTPSTASKISPKYVRVMANKIKRQDLIINKLRYRNKRLKEKIDKYEDVISSCLRKKNL